MIIDAHVHLVGEGWIHENFLLNVARIAVSKRGKNPADDPDAVLKAIKSTLFDTGGDKLVQEMDLAGVDRSCIFVVDYGLLTGEPGITIEDQNRLIAEAARRFPDRLTGFFSIDPRRPQAADLFRRAVEDWGLRGLKLHPSSGWYPFDEIVYPLYELSMQYRLPLIIHTGGQPAPMKSRFCRPAYVDDIAADFPDLPIIMAHCGFSWWEEALMVCSMKPNCHVDISGWQQEFIKNPLHFYQAVRRMVDTVGPWRVIFGSDGPYFNALCSLKDWVGAIHRPQLPSGNIVFTREETDIMMGQAIKRLLG